MMSGRGESCRLCSLRFERGGTVSVSMAVVNV
jgi:hypothetical protein